MSTSDFHRWHRSSALDRAIIFSEAAAAHEELIRTQSAGLSGEVRPLLQAGLFITATQYLAAQQARKSTIRAYRALWQSFDILVTPTSPIAAPLIGTTTIKLGENEIPLVRAFLDLTLPFNLTGQPALSLPCGFTRSGLPIGLQLVGRPFDEATLFRAGARTKGRPIGIPASRQLSPVLSRPGRFATQRAVVKGV